jgi:hypothetical protein
MKEPVMMKTFGHVVSSRDASASVRTMEEASTILI